MITNLTVLLPVAPFVPPAAPFALQQVSGVVGGAVNLATSGTTDGTVGLAGSAGLTASAEPLVTLAQTGGAASMNDALTDGLLLLTTLMMATAVVSSYFVVGLALNNRYGNLQIDGNKLPGFMPNRSFPDAVVDRMTHGLRIFYSFDELQKAWKDAPENDRNRFNQYVNNSGDLVAVITRQPLGVGNWLVRLFSSAYKVIYTYTDGELREVVARRFGGIFGDRSYTYIPRRELPPEEPSAGKKAITQVAEIGDDFVALKIHPSARAEGDEIRIFPTVDDFKLAFGRPSFINKHGQRTLAVDVGYVRRPEDTTYNRVSYWRGGNRSRDTETIALLESTKSGMFFLTDPPSADVNKTDMKLKQNGTAYSTGILEVVYDSDGRRVDSYEPNKKYTAYEVRYNYGRDGNLLRVVILKRDTSLSYNTYDKTFVRIHFRSEVLFTYKPSSKSEHRDSTAATDRPE